MKRMKLEPLDDALEALFRVERDRPDPGKPFRQAVYGVLSARLSLPDVTAGPSEPGADGASATGPSTGGDAVANQVVATVGASSSALGALLKPVVIAAFAVGAGAGAGAYATVGPTQVHTVYVDRVVSVQVPARPAPTEVASSVSGAVASPQSSAAPAQAFVTSKARGSTSAEPRAERDIDLATERTLLDAARTALGRGNSEAALDSIRRHQQQFPMSQLGDEREVIAIQALVVAGRTPEARGRATEFLRRRPNSPLRVVLEKQLGALP